LSGPGVVTLTVDLDAIEHNTRVLCGLLPEVDIVGVTKMTCGEGQVGMAMLRGGAAALGDSRHANVSNLRRAGSRGPLWLLRSAEPDLALETVRVADVSLNSELETVLALDAAASRMGAVHRVLLMVDVGDLREGVRAEELFPMLRAIRSLRHIRVEGLGTNLTCYGCVVPDEANLGELVELARGAEEIVGHSLVVSGGNSSSIPLALSGGLPAGVDNMRIGESILLGMNTLTREPLLDDLRLDAFTVRAAVVECRVKPSMPHGVLSVQDAFGNPPSFEDRGLRRRAICAVGRQDARPEGLRPIDHRIEVLGASSDHLILDVQDLDPPPRLGDAVTFIPDYGAALQLFTSPYVYKVFTPPA
jgi:predicted amino acid racemase